MITYQYRAVSAEGIKTRGVVKAIDEYEAVEKVKETCPVVLKIEPVRDKKNILTTEITPKKIDPKALSVMCSQFSIILQSGVPITKCMEMISEQTNDKMLKKMLAGSAEDVNDGSGIAAAFEKNCKELPKTFIETIRAGEESGTLERSFATLENYYSKSYKTSQKVRKALTYPIFVLVLAVAVVMLVMIYVVPTLTESFSSFGGELPAITRVLIAISTFFQKYIWVILAVMLIAAIGFNVFIRTEKGRVKWSTFKLRIPVFGKINKLNGASQFANTMAALVAAGLPINRALDVTSQVLDSYVLSLDVARMTGGIEEGKRLGECMERVKFFPKTLVDMCAIGEDTGELEETLETTGSYFDNEADHATEKALAKLEPTLLIVLAVIAGFIVLSVYLPMFSMYSLI